jgi:hypothetical protein
MKAVLRQAPFFISKRSEISFRSIRSFSCERSFGRFFGVWHGQHKVSGMGFGGVRQSVLYTRSAFNEEYMDKGRVRNWRLGLYEM